MVERTVLVVALRRPCASTVEATAGPSTSGTPVGPAPPRRAGRCRAVDGAGETRVLVAATCRSRSQSAGRAGAVEQLPRGRKVSRLGTSGQHRHARASKPCLRRRDYRPQSTVRGSAMVGASLIEFFGDELLVSGGQYRITEVFLFLIEVRCIKNRK